MDYHIPERRYPMPSPKHSTRYWGVISWLTGFSAFIWILLRSGLNPRRLTYPCQRAAMPLAINWILAIAAYLGGSLLIKRYAKFAFIPVVVAGVIWFIGAVPGLLQADTDDIASLPIWEVDDPVSTVFVMDSIPLTSGSLAPGDTTVPDEYLVDPAIDTMLIMLDAKGIHFYRTAENPDGIVGADNVVILKGNFQWRSRNTTSTDRIKGIINRIFDHPDGFTGEVVIFDNTQEIGTGINHDDNNSEDEDQSILDVVSTFNSKGYPVFCIDGKTTWDDVVSEYSSGDYGNGFVYEPETKITYPKFKSPSTDYFISFRHGIWDSLNSVYNSEKLCIIDFPVLKAHSMAGATIAVKNWIGVMTTAYANERYGGWDPMHYDYLFAPYALVSRIMEVTYPDLTIIDGAWTTTYGPNNLYWVVKTDMLIASTDPVAASWYAAKHVLTPIARYPNRTNPDLPGSDYKYCLDNWANYFRDSTEFPCARDSSEISVYNRNVLSPPPLVDIEMSPDNPPVTVPAGDSFSYTGMLSNNGNEILQGDVWIMVRNHQFDEYYGPMSRYNNIQLQAYENLIIDGIIQNVPYYAPLGMYDYIAYAGIYPIVKLDSALFQFEVTTAVSEGADEWIVSDWFDCERNQIASEIILSNNYPNPFNPVTKFEIDLPKASKVTLSVYNMMGQEVASLLDGFLDAGRHQIKWDGSAHSSGVYLYRLKTGGFELTRKMVLLK
ncbi:MAG: DUF362 domain-containing protein [candidate division Zixibacteria bacterium]|nr:DUF362 domain-containing protein [candidate division Zixibacteria bacterium]